MLHALPISVFSILLYEKYLEKSSYKIWSPTDLCTPEVNDNQLYKSALQNIVDDTEWQND